MVDTRLLTHSALTGASWDPAAGSHTLQLRHEEQGADYSLDTEAVVLATGYGYREPEFLAGVQDRIARDSRGRFAVERNYSTGVEPGEIFVQNAELHTHGFVTPDLGMAAYRNSCILREIYRPRGLSRGAKHRLPAVRNAGACRVPGRRPAGCCPLSRWGCAHEFHVPLLRPGSRRTTPPQLGHPAVRLLLGDAVRHSGGRCGGILQDPVQRAPPCAAGARRRRPRLPDGGVPSVAVTAGRRVRRAARRHRDAPSGRRRRPARRAPATPPR